MSPIKFIIALLILKLNTYHREDISLEELEGLEKEITSFIGNVHTQVKKSKAEKEVQDKQEREAELIRKREEKEARLKEAKERKIAKLPQVENVSSEDEDSLREERERLIIQIDEAGNENLFPHQEIRQFIADLAQSQEKQERLMRRQELERFKQETKSKVPQVENAYSKDEDSLREQRERLIAQIDEVDNESLFPHQGIDQFKGDLAKSQRKEESNKVIRRKMEEYKELSEDLKAKKLSEIERLVEEFNAM